MSTGPYVGRQRVARGGCFGLPAFVVFVSYNVPGSEDIATGGRVGCLETVGTA